MGVDTLFLHLTALTILVLTELELLTDILTRYMEMVQTLQEYLLVHKVVDQMKYFGVMVKL